MAETTRALQAFEDFWELGDRRSLAKLLDKYRREAKAGLDVPTKRMATLGQWSTDHNWQARAKERTAQELAERRERHRLEAERLRIEMMDGLKERITRKLEDGSPLVNDLDDLEKAGKLYFQLAGEPLEQPNVSQTTVNVNTSIDMAAGRIILDDDESDEVLSIISEATGKGEDDGAGQPQVV